MKKAQNTSTSHILTWIRSFFSTLLITVFFAYWVGYSIDENSTEMNIHLHPISLIALTLLPLIATISTILFLRRTIRTVVGIGIVILNLGFMFLFLSSTYMNTVGITPEYIAETNGTYFNPSTSYLYFTDIQSITIDWHSTGRFMNRLWIIKYKDNHQEEIEPSPAWEYNEAEIVQKLQQFGVTVYRN